MRRMEKVWRLVLDEVRDATYVCHSAENLMYDGKISKAEQAEVLKVVRHEARRLGVGRDQLHGYGLWAPDNPAREAWVKAQITLAHKARRPQ